MHRRTLLRLFWTFECSTSTYLTCASSLWEHFLSHHEFWIHYDDVITPKINFVCLLVTFLLKKNSVAVSFSSGFYFNSIVSNFCLKLLFVEYIMHFAEPISPEVAPVLEQNVCIEMIFFGRFSNICETSANEYKPVGTLISNIWYEILWDT